MLQGDLDVMLYVHDLKRSVDFYRHVLDFGVDGYWDDASQEVVDDWEEAEEPGYAEVRVGDDTIGLHPNDEIEPGETRIKLSIAVDDVDAVHERVAKRGAEATEPEDFSWGARMFTVTDPDGHEIDILEPLE